MEIHDLAELIGPGSEARLLDHFERKEPLLLKGDAEAIGGLLTREEIGRLLDTGAFTPPQVRLASSGEPIAKSFYLTPEGTLDPPALNRMLGAGASLVFDDIGPLVPRLARLERGIERRLRAKINSNAYFTPARGAALAPHYDNHDVLVVQVGGTKAWELLGPVEPAARSRRQYVPRKGQGEREASWRHTLQPGELLYLPRGQWHRATVADAGWSLHLSITIVRQSALDYLRWLFETLADDELLARDLPSLAGEDALRNHERAVRERLVAALEHDGLAAYLAAADAERHPDSAFKLAADPASQPSDVLVSTLRRPLPPAGKGAGKLRVGGARLTPAMEATLRLLDGAGHGMRYDVLIEQLREAWPDEAVAGAIARLRDEGLVSTL